MSAVGKCTRPARNSRKLRKLEEKGGPATRPPEGFIPLPSLSNSRWVAFPLRLSPRLLFLRPPSIPPSTRAFSPFPDWESLPASAFHCERASRGRRRPSRASCRSRLRAGNRRSSGSRESRSVPADSVDRIEELHVARALDHNTVEVDALHGDGRHFPDRSDLDAQTLTFGHEAELFRYGDSRQPVLEPAFPAEVGSGLVPLEGNEGDLEGGIRWGGARRKTSCHSP